MRQNQFVDESYFSDANRVIEAYSDCPAISDMSEYFQKARKLKKFTYN